MELVQFLQSNTGLIQTGYVVLLVLIIAVFIPNLLKQHTKERDKFVQTIEKRDARFFEVIESYRDALIDFQQKEDQSHQDLAVMMGDCREKVAAEHKELLRALKVIANKLEADIIE